MDSYIKGLALYSPLWIRLKKARDALQNEKMRSLKVRCYAARLIDLLEYLAYFPGATLSDKMDVTKLKEIIFNSMRNSWSKQDYVQVFYYESIFLRKLLTCLSVWKSQNIFTKV